MKFEYNCELFHRNLHKLWQADKYCDVNLIGADGKTSIRAHRLVLAAASPYFEDRAPNVTGNMEEIVVAAVDVDTLQQLVGMCYSGSLIVDENNVSNVYMGAIHLQLNALLPELDNYIMTLLDNSNCLHFHKLANTFSRSVLLEAAERYISEHFIEICDRPSFLELDAGYLNKLLGLEELQVPSVEDLFLKVIKWIQHTPDGHRDEALAELLPNLKLSLMSPEFLSKEVKPLCKTAEMKDLMIAALVSKPEPIPPVPVDVQRERLLVVAGHYGKKHKILEYSFEQQKWIILARLPTAVFNHAVDYCMASNSLCFVGGYNDSETNDFLLWNLQSKKFMKMVNLPTPRSRARIISLNDADGDLIVVDGYDGQKAISTVERWSCESGKWHTLKSTQETKYCASLVRVGNLIYSIGGRDDECEDLKSVECYNLTEDRWSTLAPLHHARTRCGTMYDGGKIYVIGSQSDVIECYDPNKNEWTELCTVYDSVAVSHCVRYNGCIVAFALDKVLISDGDWKIWKKSDSIPAVNGFIYGAFTIPPE